ncbi:MAG: hypothetical protein OEQ74_04000 [Gammaproteobacteria bacterium]|nr:hypothetical protein [Gammaproteobacteria bacterium]
MLRLLLLAAMLIFAGVTAIADEAPENAADAASTDETQPEEEQGDGIERPKTMSGMSILGNEEAPKSLVIIPWKSSELGEDIKLSNTLDDRAQPVDKEVFLRELSFYLIRSGE